jgi:senataxin
MSSSDTAALMIDLENLREEVRHVERDIEEARKTRDNGLLEDLICRRRDVKREINKKNHIYEESRRAASVAILSRADVIFTTLSGAFSKDMEHTGGGWPFVIVDEACQASELATLIPMQYGAKNTVLIGDPMQLPGITCSRQSIRTGFNRSLFERMMSAGCPVTMLEVQYRMAPSIRSFPSFFFYHNRLRDAREVVSRTQPDWLPREAFVFIDLLTSKEIREGSDLSMKNYSEAEFIVNLYRHYKAYHGTGLDIGVITPYKSQVHAIRRLLESQFGADYKKDIEVSTVDGFQGREKAVIIFSCVRSGDYIGFLSDKRRLNVAITRAKYGLWVVGSAQCLLRQVTWRDFVGFALQDDVLVKARTQLEIPSIFGVNPSQLRPHPNVPHHSAPLPPSAILPIRVDKPSEVSQLPFTRQPHPSNSTLAKLQPHKTEAPVKLLEQLVSEMKSQRSELQDRGL